MADVGNEPVVVDGHVRLRLADRSPRDLSANAVPALEITSAWGETAVYANGMLKASAREAQGVPVLPAAAEAHFAGLRVSS